ncbi:DUF4352 domain-containing protein [Janibacter sp. GXQ6167]|uniref:DUF4352 domain-containing protein n=1 Tax=Janibacter sp. GXQ6167 TaxID=3240791 RepID=UPI003525D78D
MTQPTNPPPGDQQPGDPQWQPTYAAPPPAQKSWFARNKLLSFLLGVGLIMLLCCGGLAMTMVGGSDSGSNTDSSSAGKDGSGDSEAGAPKAGSPAIGDAVRDGKFEFVVKSVKTGVDSVGNDILGEKAQGQFVLVNLEVTNIGDEAQYFADSDQKLVDDKGRSFASNSTAGISIEGNEDVWLSEINPGNTKKGTIVFDMPKGAKATKIELHDSAFSDGAEVSLTK